MKGKCTAKFNSNLSKHKVEMFMERELNGATLKGSYNVPHTAFLISVEKDNSGYNDRSSITILMDLSDAEELAWEILKGIDREQGNDCP